MPAARPLADDHAASAAADTSSAAVQAYRRRLRKWRIVYAAGIVALLIAAVVVVRVAYSAGELAHTTLRPATSAAPSVSGGAPPAVLRLAWRTSDSPAVGVPFYEGTVVTSDRHSVRGRNGLNGSVRWSYTRTDRSVCAAVQDGAVTIAVYRLHGNCDELTALDTATGRRSWTRTLDKDGAAFDGPARYAVATGNVLFVSRTAIYSIDPSGSTDTEGGLDHWTFSHPGCAISAATLGSEGALISQTCSGEDCSNTDSRYCGDGPQLLLRDAQAGNNTDTSNNHQNPDQVRWNDRGSRLRAVMGGPVVAAQPPGAAALNVLDADKGSTIGHVPLRTAARRPPAVQPVADGDLLWSNGVTYAITQSGAVQWRRPTAGPASTSLEGTDTLARSQITAVAGGAVVTLNGTSGRVMHRYPVSVGGARRAWPYGAGFVVAGNGTQVYR